MPRGEQTLTLEQVEAKQRKAVQFVADVLDDPEKADELESLSPQEYAERKGIRIIEANPKQQLPRKEHKPMAAKGPSKQELEDLLDEVAGKVTELLDSELTRKEIVIGLKDLNDIVNGPDEDDDDEDTDEIGEEDDDEE